MTPNQNTGDNNARDNSARPHRRPYSAAPRRAFNARPGGRPPFRGTPHRAPQHAPNVNRTPSTSTDEFSLSALAPSGASVSSSAPAHPAHQHRPRQGGQQHGHRRFDRGGHSRSGGTRGRGPRSGGGARGHFRRPPAMPRNPINTPEARERVVLPPLDADTVRVIPIGGVEEVGRNMCAFELPEGIIISDAGFQFMGDSDAPGIDYVLPNTRWLEDNKDRIIGLFITHGHLDHIGGIPFIIDRIGNPPIYTQFITSLMILKRQEEFPHLPKVDMRVVEPGGTVRVGKEETGFVTVKTFPVTHSIPDAMGLSIQTKHGNIVVSGDLKLEHTDGTPSDKEIKVWGDIGKDRNILFMADSTNAERDGFSIPEKRVFQTLEDILKTVKGRIIVALFASNFERVIRIITTAEALGKKVVIVGRSHKTNVEIAERAELLKIAKGTIIPEEAISDYPPEKIVIVSTGAQGEENAALMRIATKKHKTITFSERDTVVLSSSVIPGNEINVQKLKDNLLRHGLTIVHYRSSDVHSTGHGNTGELIWMRSQVNPQFFMPAYGFYSMLKNHANAQINAGFPRERVIIPDNGFVIEIKNGTELTVREEKIPSGPMMVDGFSIGDMQEVVIRDRQSLASDGMFVIIATINIKTGELKKSPDIISRGFVYLREAQNLLAESRLLVKKEIEAVTVGMNPVDLEMVKQPLTDAVEKFLFQKTSKKPMVIPVLIGV